MGKMDEVGRLIGAIETYCQQTGIAESTFGRLAVNDGKFVARLRSGKGMTMKTHARVRTYLDHNPTSGEPPGTAGGGEKSGPLPPPAKAGAKGGDTFRFYDNRQKYLMFVNTCSEKWMIAERVGMELAQIRPTPPALRVFDAGMGDGTVITRTMRDMHRRFPAVPFFIVGKEISLEDVRLSLEKMPDRFFEHPQTVLVVTNLYYAEAPWLMPRSVSSAAALNWQEVALSGSTAHEFTEQINALQPILDDGWQVRASAKTGNPLYVRPSVLVLYREDHKFMLDQVIPKPGRTQGLYDLIIASQPYRANMPVDFKVQKILAPLARSLGPGGRMLGIHSYGRDPGLEIIQRVWPGRELGHTDRHCLMQALKQEIGRGERDLRFNTYADKRSLFRYEMHTLPSEITENIGTSTLFAAWNAAIYVYQIEDERLADVISDGRYLEATRDVLQEHGGLWFIDESYVISRKRG